MTPILFSVIIPVYNVEAYLKQCLDSAVGQTYTNVEIICVNDGSTDDSSSILDEYASNHTNFTLLYQENQGLSAARNAGIRAAKGDYVFFLDSDDWIEPDTFKLLAEKQKGEDLVCFNGRRYFEDGTAEAPDPGMDDPVLTGWEYYNKYASVSRKFHFVCTVLRLYRREYLLKNSLFFEEGIYHEDNLFTPLACYYAKRVKVISDVLYVYRIRAGSITQSVFSEQSKIKRIHDIVRVNNSLLRFFIPIENISKQLLYKNVSTELMHLINMINVWNLNDRLELVYAQIDWDNFKKSIRSLDLFILYKLLLSRKLKLYYQLYYFDFYIVRKYFRKFRSLVYDG